MKSPSLSFSVPVSFQDPPLETVSLLINSQFGALFCVFLLPSLKQACFQQDSRVFLVLLSLCSLPAPQAAGQERAALPRSLSQIVFGSF